MVVETLNLAKKHDLNVIPIAYKDKKPLAPWEKYQHEKATGDELKEWFGNGKKTNIGIVCGAISGNLAVVDFDSEELYPQFFSRLDGLEKQTAVIKTGRGVHVYFRTRVPIRTFGIKDREGREVITVKGEGGYVIGPGSIHPNGSKYEFISDGGIVQVDGDLRQELIERAEKLGLKVPREDSIDIKNILKGVSEGSRDNSALCLATWLRRQGKNKEETLEILKRWDERNRPLLGGAALELKVESAFKTAEPYGYFFVQNPERYELDGLKLRKQADSGEKTKGECANIIADEHSFAALEDTKEIFVYRDGVYVPGETLIHEKVEAYFGGEKVSRHLASEVSFVIQVNNYRKREEFDSDPYVINLRNGLLDIKTGELKRPCHTFLSLIQLPIIYDPEADCPRWRKFLEEVVNNDRDRLVLQEMSGFTLMPSYPIHKAFLIEGKGGEGKSVFLETLAAMLGDVNVSNIALQDLENNRFARARLFGKKANIYADIPPNELKTTGIFKVLTGGDRISAEYKGRDGFEFRNAAKLIFSCNKVPKTADDTDAFFQRWIVITFSNQFRGTDKEDRGLKEKLRAELPGIFNWALQGLHRLLEQGGFSLSQSTDDMRERWTRLSNTIAAFYKDMLEGDADAYVLKAEMYSTYVQYCHDTEVSPEHKQTFGMKLPRESANVRAAQKRIRGKRERVWIGVRLRENDAQGVTGLDFQGCDTLKKGTKNRQVSQPSRASLYPRQTTESLVLEEGKKEELNKKNVLITAKDLGEGCDGCDTEEIPPQKERLFSLLNSIKQTCKEHDTAKEDELKDFYALNKLPEALLDEDLQNLKDAGKIYEPEHNEWRAV